MESDHELPLLDRLLRQLGVAEKAPFAMRGQSAESLVDKYGSPLYVHDADAMLAHVQSVRAAFGEGVELLYALKANPLLGIAELMEESGLGAEVASRGELLLASKAGFDPEKIEFAGPGKSDEDLALAVQMGIASINIESESEYERILAMARSEGSKPRLALRINPDLELRGARMRMSGGPKKFGIDASELAPLAQRILSDGLCELVGLHCYVGTQILDASAFLDIARVVLETAQKLEAELGLRFAKFNLGGGFGVATAERDGVFDLRAAGHGLGELVAEFGMQNRRFRLELGRYLVAEAGVFLTRVLHVKKSHETSYAIVDGGMHQHSAAAGVGSVLRRSWPILACKAPRFAADGARGIDERGWAVAGPLCTPQDEFCAEATLPELERGDLLAILVSGAYGYSFSNLRFLSHPAPAELLLEGGAVHCLRARVPAEEWLHGQTSRRAKR